MSETEALDSNPSAPGRRDRRPTSNPGLAGEKRAAGLTAVKDQLEELINKRPGAEVTWCWPGLPEL